MLQDVRLGTTCLAVRPGQAKVTYSKVNKSSLENSKCSLTRSDGVTRYCDKSETVQEGSVRQELYEEINSSTFFVDGSESNLNIDLMKTVTCGANAIMKKFSSSPCLPKPSGDFYSTVSEGHATPSSGGGQKNVLPIIGPVHPSNVVINREPCDIEQLARKCLGLEKQLIHTMSLFESKGLPLAAYSSYDVKDFPIVTGVKADDLFTFK